MESAPNKMDDEKNPSQKIVLIEGKLYISLHKVRTESGDLHMLLGPLDIFSALPPSQPMPVLGVDTRNPSPLRPPAHSECPSPTKKTPQFPEDPLSQKQAGPVRKKRSISALPTMQYTHAPIPPKNTAPQHTESFLPSAMPSGRPQIDVQKTMNSSFSAQSFHSLDEGHFLKISNLTESPAPFRHHPQYDDFSQMTPTGSQNDPCPSHSTRSFLDNKDSIKQETERAPFMFDIQPNTIEETCWTNEITNHEEFPLMSGAAFCGGDSFISRNSSLRPSSVGPATRHDSTEDFSGQGRSHSVPVDHFEQDEFHFRPQNFDFEDSMQGSAQLRLFSSLPERDFQQPPQVIKPPTIRPNTGPRPIPMSITTNATPQFMSSSDSLGTFVSQGSVFVAPKKNPPMSFSSSSLFSPCAEHSDSSLDQGNMWQI